MKGSKDPFWIKIICLAQLTLVFLITVCLYGWLFTLMTSNHNKLMEIWQRKWPNFAPEEVLSPRGMELFKVGYLPMQVNHMDRLQRFRMYLDRQFFINYAGLPLRGWRSFEENRSVGGKLYHPTGLATDTTVDGMTPQEVADAAIEFGFTGIGIYDTFCHLDSRPGKLAVWDFRS